MPAEQIQSVLDLVRKTQSAVARLRAEADCAHTASRLDYAMGHMDSAARVLNFSLFTLTPAPDQRERILKKEQPDAADGRNSSREHSR